jgi:hypothetical protein
MDDKYGWALRVKTRLDSAVAEIRGSERGASY